MIRGYFYTLSHPRYCNRNPPSLIFGPPACPRGRGFPPQRLGKAPIEAQTRGGYINLSHTLRYKVGTYPGEAY